MAEKTSNWIRNEMYNGEVVIEFLPSKHWYRHEGAKQWDFITSVTGATGMYDKSRPLIKWAVNLDIDHIEEYLESCEDQIEKSLLLPVLEEAREIHNQKKEQAGTAGDIVHKFAEVFAENKLANKEADFKTIYSEAVKRIEDEGKSVEHIEEMKEQAENGIRSFLKWYNENDVEILFSERLTYSKKHNYVGTADLIARVNGKLSLVDYKTSSGVYNDHRFQVSAYWNSVDEEGFIGDKIEQALILHFDKDTGDFGEPVTINKTDHKKNLKAFIGLLAVKERSKVLDKEWRANNKK